MLDTWEIDLNLDFHDVLGKEAIIETVWDRVKQHYVKREKQVFIDPCHLNEALATECYHGGRNEQFWFGPAHEAEWTDFDLSSAYPTAMSLIGMPRWDEMFHTNDTSLFTATSLGFACVDFVFPTTVPYPCLPVRTDNGLVFPRKGRSYCCSPEIFLALQLGADLRIVEGLIVPTDPEVRVFGAFIKKCIERRNSFPKKTLKNLLWKEISNSTYGKTAQGLKQRRVFDMREKEMRRLPESRITNPFFAAFITSSVRAVLGEIMNSLPRSRMVFSCTTDGFLTDATDNEVKATMAGDLTRAFADGLNLISGNPHGIEAKHRIRRPLGWTTRGQATLVPGDEKAGDPDFHIVLARAGVSVPPDLTKEEQNSLMVSRFLARKPTDKIPVRFFTSVREMVTCDADLVLKEIEKRLSMEFDWKRRPTAIITDPKTGHVAFGTEPWESVDDFRAVGEMWSAFQKKDPICIKTEADFEAFEVFAESALSLNAEARKNLRKADPDLARLRMALCQAWATSRAGLKYGVNGNSKRISAADFAKLLTDCGIPCQRADVENARKKADFVPRSCPPTRRCLQALGKLRERFPAIVASEIFSDRRWSLRAPSGQPTINANLPIYEQRAGADTAAEIEGRPDRHEKPARLLNRMLHLIGRSITDRTKRGSVRRYLVDQNVLGGIGNLIAAPAARDDWSSLC